MVSPFEDRLQEKNDISNPFEKRLKEKKVKKQEPVSLKGAASAYGSGFGGGVGGIFGDLLPLMGVGGMLAKENIPSIKTTPELTHGIQQEFGLQEPSNALERILQQGGEFGGMETTLGAATGGPVGAGVGAAHGTASGLLYGGLKELGMDDNWALGVTMLATVSPIAFQRLWPKIVEKFKSGSTFEETMKTLEKEIPSGEGGTPPPPPGEGSSPSKMSQSRFSKMEKINSFSDADWKSISKIKKEHDITTSEAIEIYLGERPPPGSEGSIPSSGREVPQEMAREPIPVEEAPTQQYLPEEQKINAPPELLKSDYEIAEDIRGTLSPLNQESNKLPDRTIPRTVNAIFEPVQEELNAISPARLNDPNSIGREAARVVKRASKEIYDENSRLWRQAEELASEEISTRPILVNKLRSIVEESPSHPVAGEAKLQNFAEDLMNKLEVKRGKKIGYRPVSNAQLIKEIKQARASGYDYRYSGGVQSHRLNEFMNAVEQELIRTSSEESRLALLRARDGYKNWAVHFKDDLVLPFRKLGLEKPQSLYEKLKSPDTFNILADILSQDRKGRYLMQVTARNMVEKALEPYLMRPQSFNPVKFEEAMAKLRGIVPEEMISSLEQKLLQLQEQSINKVQIPGPTAPSFATITEGQISSKLRTIEGLRELKSQLEKVPGGLEKYREISGTMGIDLLFGGQMNVPANSDRIRKMLNDRNGRPYIKETLGEENLKVLDDLVKNNSLEKRLTEIKESPTLSSMVKDPDILIKGVKLLYHILRGSPMSVITNARSIHKRLLKNIGKQEEMIVPPADINIQ